MSEKLARSIEVTAAAQAAVVAAAADATAKVAAHNDAADPHPGKFAPADLGGAAQQAAIKAKANAAGWLSLAPVGDPQPVMASPPTVTNAASSQISGGIFCPPWTQDGGATTSPASGQFRLYRGDYKGAGAARYGFNNLTATLTPTYTGDSWACGFNHTGTEFEFIVANTGVGFTIKVDGAYVSLTQITLAGGSANAYYRVVFASRARRRIEIIGRNITFAGLVIGGTDAIEPIQIDGPRCMVVGDSFTNPTPYGIADCLADALGWSDVWSSGLGSTGYIANAGGTAPTFRGRLAHDVIAYAPEVVVIYGSINDAWSDVATEAGLFYAQLRAGLPNALIFAAVNQSGGVNKLPTAAFTYKNAIKTAVESVGGYFIDFQERPMLPSAATAYSGTIKNTYSAGQLGSTGIHISAGPPIGFTLLLGGTERVEVTGGSQVNGTTWNILFDGALQYAHANGEVFASAPPSLWTGRGRVGATTGYGNSDLWVSSDNVHPTGEGYRGQGYALAAGIKRVLRSLLAS